jgi:hypothetical protein
LRGSENEPFSARWLWLFPPAYLIHLLDERFWGSGTANWAYLHTGTYFTNEAWLAVNVPSMILLTVAAGLCAARIWPQWVAIALAIHFVLHTLVRVVGTPLSGVIAPGLVSGVLVCLPLAVPTLRRGYRALPWPAFRNGLVVGILSFQPLWHTILLPLLPRGPSD